MNKRRGYSPEVRERAVRLVLTSEQEHSSRWAAITSVAAKIGCTPETLRSWMNKMEVDSGAKPRLSSDEAARIKALEREPERRCERVKQDERLKPEIQRVWEESDRNYGVRKVWKQLKIFLNISLLIKQHHPEY